MGLESTRKWVLLHSCVIIEHDLQGWFVKKQLIGRCVPHTHIPRLIRTYKQNTVSVRVCVCVCVWVCVYLSDPSWSRILHYESWWQTAWTVIPFAVALTVTSISKVTVFSRWSDLYTREGSQCKGEPKSLLFTRSAIHNSLPLSSPLSALM